MNNEIKFAAFMAFWAFEDLQERTKLSKHYLSSIHSSIQFIFSFIEEE